MKTVQILGPQTDNALLEEGCLPPYQSSHTPTEVEYLDAAAHLERRRRVDQLFKSSGCQDPNTTIPGRNLAAG